MDKKQWMIGFWKEVAEQNGPNLRTYFTSDAIVNWHNTNERFSVDEYIVANCEYPGDWCGHVERVEVVTDDLIVTVTRIWSADDGSFCHAVSFFQLRDHKIAQLDEYWGDDGKAPQWRLNKKIGATII